MEVLPPFWVWQCHVVARRPIRRFSPVKLPTTDNVLLKRNVVQPCLAANNILPMRKWNHAFLLLAVALAWKWQIASPIIKKQTRWSNDKTTAKSRYFAQPCTIIVNYSLPVWFHIAYVFEKNISFHYDRSRLHLHTSNTRCFRLSLVHV